MRTAYARRSRLFHRSFFVSMWAFAAIGGSAAEGATYTITTLVEDTVANGNCTLREALLAASTDTTQDLCIGDNGPDTIVLEAIGTYTLHAGGLGSANRQLTIRGNASHPRTSYVVELGGLQRLLFVLDNSSLTLENFTAINGFAPGNGGTILAEDSDLTLRRMAIQSSRAANGGGVAFISHGSKALDIEDTIFEGNRIDATQAFGGALVVDLQAGGAVRVVGATFLSNEINATSENWIRTGAGLYLQSFAPAAVELRHLRFYGNSINSPSAAMGAGARIELWNQATGSLEIEDAEFENNSFGTPSATSLDVGLSLAADGGSLTARRVRLVQNHGGSSCAQGTIGVLGAAEATISDFLVGNGDGWGLFLSTAGTAYLVAGNLTVAGHPDDGLILAENGGTLRVENSIAFGNAVSTGSNVNLFFGTPDVSAETLVGVDPQFLNAAGGDFRLGPGSVAAEAGNEEFPSVGPYDVAHGDRVVGVQIDLGALERGALFSDNFERGDLYAWSAFIP